MLTIIHGENLVKSRQELERIKEENSGNEIVFLDGKQVDLMTLKQALETQSMFQAKRLVVIENLTAQKSKANLEKIINYIPLKEYSHELVIWENTSLAKTILAKLRADRIFEFKPEPVVFKLLESLRPNNQREILILLLRSIRIDGPEIVFYMLIRQFRLLIMVKDGVMSGTDELDRLAAWQKQRLIKQANYFTLAQLIAFYRRLLTIDVEQKTGQASFDLAKTLELFLTNL